MKLKLAAAAKRAGVSRSTIHRAMKRGTLSFERDANGERMVDTSELSRIFDLTPPPTVAPDTPATVARHVSGHGEKPAEILAVQLEAERDKVAMLEAQVRDLRAERDRLLALIEAERPQRQIEDRAWRWRWWKRG